MTPPIINITSRGYEFLAVGVPERITKTILREDTISETTSVWGYDIENDFHDDGGVSDGYEHLVELEEGLSCFDSIIDACCEDFIKFYSSQEYGRCYIYLTAKHMFSVSGCPINRPGYHSDGFGTVDINYIWYDKDRAYFVGDSTYEITIKKVRKKSRKSQQ